MLCGLCCIDLLHRSGVWRDCCSLVTVAVTVAVTLTVTSLSTSLHPALLFCVSPRSCLVWWLLLVRWLVGCRYPSASLHSSCVVLCCVVLQLCCSCCIAAISPHYTHPPHTHHTHHTSPTSVQTTTNAPYPIPNCEVKRRWGD